MNVNRNPGRVAGLFYLLLVLLAPIRLMYIPSKLFVSGDAAATARNIADHQTLFRIGMAADVACGVVLIFLLLALYRLFEGVNRRQAVLMVIVGGILPATIYFVNVLNDAAALMLVRGGEYLTVFSQAQREALALLFVRLHNQVVVAAETLWGVWLFPLGALIYKSGFLPRFLGVWLVINGIAYILMSASGLLWPQYQNTISNWAFPALLGEMVVMLWLVIRGAKPRADGVRASAG